jgi:oxygen-independent coproporphyrinogen III oxidase
MEIKKNYLQGEIIESVYFGGGTPSVLGYKEVLKIINGINHLYHLSADCEITFEANPDDLSRQYLKELSNETPINRLSIGIQSFNDRDLRLLNRRHNASQAIQCLENANRVGFKNLSIDLIYGLPQMSNEDWETNLRLAFSSGIKHLSAYCLSVEKGTKLSKMYSAGLIRLQNEDNIIEHFSALDRIASQNGFMHYEISNLSLDGYVSRHNTNYWLQKKYLGLGPSANSFDKDSRQWNVCDVRKYMKAINSGLEFFKKEKLNPISKFNEYVMLSLRTKWGINSQVIEDEFGEEICYGLLKSIHSFVNTGHVIQEKQNFRLSLKGWLISDYIISELMK